MRPGKSESQPHHPDPLLRLASWGVCVCLCCGSACATLPPPAAAPSPLPSAIPGGSQPGGQPMQAPAQQTAPVSPAAPSATLPPPPTQAAAAPPTLLRLEFPPPTSGSEAGFAYLALPGADPLQQEGLPVVPVLAAAEIPLPPGVQLHHLSVTPGEAADLGEIDLPTVTIGPFSAGGVQLAPMHAPDAYLPAGLAWFEAIDGGVRILVAPVQHNPCTNQTRFYPSLDIHLVYTALP